VGVASRCLDPIVRNRKRSFDGSDCHVATAKVRTLVAATLAITGGPSAWVIHGEKFLVCCHVHNAHRKWMNRTAQSKIEPMKNSKRHPNKLSLRTFNTDDNRSPILLLNDRSRYHACRRYRITLAGCIRSILRTTQCKRQRERTCALVVWRTCASWRRRPTLAEVSARPPYVVFASFNCARHAPDALSLIGSQPLSSPRHMERATGGPTNLIVAIGQYMLDESRWLSVQDHFRLPNDRQIFHSPTLHFYSEEL
jgi:hypothetical protein